MCGKGMEMCIRDRYKSLSIEDLSKKMIKGGAFIDVKAAFDPAAIKKAGYKLWRL